MLRHVVMFNWKPEASESDKQAVRDGLAELPDKISAIRRYQFGDDLGLAEGNFEFVLVADFDDQRGYQAYMNDATHQAVIRDLIKPIAAGRAAVQHSVDGMV